jgi:uncharacterized protein YoxC
MPDTHVYVHLLEGTANITTLHIHVGCDENKLGEIMAAIDDLNAKVTEVSTAVSTVLTNTTELVKDVQRLLAQGDVSGATTALASVVTSLEEANTKLAEVDAAVEAASPETTPEPVPAPEENLFA